MVAAGMDVREIRREYPQLIISGGGRTRNAG
jgi:hypothetical protein